MTSRYVANKRTPDFKAQHPRNYAEIEAQQAEWGVCLDPFKTEAPAWLI